MSKETIKAGVLGTVFATTGTALPVTVALIAYIGLWCIGTRQKNVALTPPAANR